MAELARLVETGPDDDRVDWSKVEEHYTAGHSMLAAMDRVAAANPIGGTRLPIRVPGGRAAGTDPA